jgi:hypothetical protein
VFVIELDLAHLETAAPLRLVPQTILKRTACVLLGDQELYSTGKAILLLPGERDPKAT